MRRRCGPCSGRCDTPAALSAPHTAGSPSASRTERIVAEEGAQIDFSQDMSCSDYLHLDKLLTARHPLSPAHNEMLFIVQHRTSALWMKLLQIGRASCRERVCCKV